MSKKLEEIEKRFEERLRYLYSDAIWDGMKSGEILAEVEKAKSAYRLDSMSATRWWPW